MEKIDHKYTRNIVCPYCGYEDRDSWEVCPEEEDLGIVECGRCEKEFYASRIVTVEYSTYKIEECYE
jgi:transcription elongation factor Elf1